MYQIKKHMVSFFWKPRKNKTTKFNILVRWAKLGITTIFSFHHQLCNTLRNGALITRTLTHGCTKPSTEFTALPSASMMRKKLNWEWHCKKKENTFGVFSRSFIFWRVIEDYRKFILKILWHHLRALVDLRECFAPKLSLHYIGK